MSRNIGSKKTIMIPVLSAYWKRVFGATVFYNTFEIILWTVDRPL